MQSPVVDADAPVPVRSANQPLSRRCSTENGWAVSREMNTPVEMSFPGAAKIPVKTPSTPSKESARDGEVGTPAGEWPDADDCVPVDAGQHQVQSSGGHIGERHEWAVIWDRRRIDAIDRRRICHGDAVVSLGAGGTLWARHGARGPRPRGPQAGRPVVSRRSCGPVAPK